MHRHPLSSLLRVLGAFGLAVSVAQPVLGWSATTQKTLAFDAARLTPPDLYRQLARNHAAYAVGVNEPFADTDPANHVKYPDGRGRLDQVIRVAVDNAVKTIQAHRPFNEIAYRLGLVSHYVAKANCPLYLADHDPLSRTYHRDYQGYAERAEPRLRRVFYGYHPRFDGKGDLDRLLAAAFARGRSGYDMLGREYRRVGLEQGSRAFDDRSTAFAVTALAHSHAVSDIAQVLRYIWLEAGGIDTRPWLPQKGRTKPYLLPRVPAP